MSTVALPRIFPNCPALDGCFGLTCSLEKIFLAHGHPLSEEMLFGLGAGIDFLYWQIQLRGQEMVFIGGRVNSPAFMADLGGRTGVQIREIHSTSAARAEALLLAELEKGLPVMLGGDMGLLPWFSFPPGIHFGAHVFVICGYDGQQTLLGSDLDLNMRGRRRGFHAPITLEQLREARGSEFKPFPPKNRRFEFDFSGFRIPERTDILEAIAQSANQHYNPQIRNIGLSGMRHAAKELPQWPMRYNEEQLRNNLLYLYRFMEIGSTGDGCFRAMYARFLGQAAQVAQLPELAEFGMGFEESARRFSNIALLFENAPTVTDLLERIAAASEAFASIADIEEPLWLRLAAIAAEHGISAIR